MLMIYSAVNRFLPMHFSLLEIAHAVIAECGGPMPDKSAEFFYGLEKNGVIELKKKKK